MRILARLGRHIISSAIGLGLSLSILTCISMPSNAQVFPSKVISLVVPYSAGTGIDLATRMLAEVLQTETKQPIIVENKTGASGNIGTGFVAKARPDGYTLLVAANTLAMSASLYHLPYDPLKSFSSVTLLFNGAMVLAVSPNLEAKSVKDLVALAKAKPGMLGYGSPGIGTPQHLAMELFENVTGTELTRIPYKGMSEALIGTLSGENQLMFVPIQSALPFLQDGKIRGLAVSSPARNAFLPDLPSLAQALDVSGFDVDLWYGLFAPAGTPETVIQSLNASVSDILRRPAFQDKLRALALVGTPSSPKDLEVLLQNDTARWAKVITAAGITPQ